MAPLPSTTITKPEIRFDHELPTPAEVEDLYRQHRTDGIRFARRRGADDPESLFNQVFVDVMAKARTIDGPPEDAIAAYLYRSINNRIIAEHRKRREPLVTYDERIHGSYDPSKMFEDEVVDSEWVDELLDHLTDSERDVVVNRYFEERNSVETALVLNKTPEAVRQLHRSAMVRLRFVLTVTAVVVVALLAVAALVSALSDPVSTAPAETGEPDSLPLVEDEDAPDVQTDQDGAQPESQSDGQAATGGSNTTATSNAGQVGEDGQSADGGAVEEGLAEGGPGVLGAGLAESGEGGGTPAIRGTEGLPTFDELEGTLADEIQQPDYELDQFGNEQPTTPTEGL